jgi:hypothetical protein
VMQHGRITGELVGADATEESVLGLAMVDQLSTVPAGTVTPTQENGTA